MIRLTATAQQFPPPLPSAVDKETLAELSHWGNNLNQVSYVLNAARQQGILDDGTANRVFGELVVIAANLDQIRRKVVS